MRNAPLLKCPRPLLSFLPSLYVETKRHQQFEEERKKNEKKTTNNKQTTTGKKATRKKKKKKRTPSLPFARSCIDRTKKKTKKQQQQPSQKNNEQVTSHQCKSTPPPQLPSTPPIRRTSLAMVVPGSRFFRHVFLFAHPGKKIPNTKKNNEIRSPLFVYGAVSVQLKGTCVPPMTPHLSRTAKSHHSPGLRPSPHGLSVCFRPSPGGRHHPRRRGGVSNCYWCAQRKEVFDLLQSAEATALHWV